MTIPQLSLSENTKYNQAHAQLATDEHDTSAKPPTIGLALAHLIESMQTAKRAGMSLGQVLRHVASLWTLVPLEDADV